MTRQVHRCLEIVVEEARRHELRARVLNLRDNGGALLKAGVNHLRFEWQAGRSGVLRTTPEEARRPFTRGQVAWTTMT